MALTRALPGVQAHKAKHDVACAKARVAVEEQ